MSDYAIDSVKATQEPVAAKQKRKPKKAKRSPPRLRTCRKRRPVPARTT